MLPQAKLRSSRFLIDPALAPDVQHAAGRESFHSQINVRKADESERSGFSEHCAELERKVRGSAWTCRTYLRGQRKSGRSQ